MLAPSLSSNERNDLRGYALFTGHFLSCAIDVGRGDIVAGNARVNAATGSIREAVEDSGDQCDHHHHRDDDQQDSQEEILSHGGRFKNITYCVRIKSGWTNTR